MTKTISSRDFNQDVGGAKKAANRAPVVITERGRPSHVLMSYATYEKLKGPRKTIGDLLYMSGVADVEFDDPSRDDVSIGADFS